MHRRLWQKVQGQRVKCYSLPSSPSLLLSLPLNDDDSGNDEKTERTEAEKETLCRSGSSSGQSISGHLPTLPTFFSMKCLTSLMRCERLICPITKGCEPSFCQPFAIYFFLNLNFQQYSTATAL